MVIDMTTPRKPLWPKIVATVIVVFPVLYLILLNTRAARSWFRYRTY